MTVYTKYEPPTFRSHPKPPVVLPPPCQFCGAQEKIVDGEIQQVAHDYSKHPGLENWKGVAQW